jgi:hypothetical protein
MSYKYLISQGMVLVYTCSPVTTHTIGDLWTVGPAGLSLAGIIRRLQNDTLSHYSLASWSHGPPAGL